MAVYTVKGIGGVQEGAIIPTKTSCKNSVVVDEYFRKMKTCLFYHGTSKEYAKDICRHGMDVSRKRSGSTAILERHTGLTDREANLYNYVMGRESAARYAQLHEHPKIVRMIIPSNIQLRSDPQGFNHDEKRTKSKISSRLILPLKPENLKRSQVRKIILALGLKPICCHQHTLELRNRIRTEMIENDANSDRPFLERKESFIEMEQKRHQITLTLLKNQGIELDSLKEGDEISISL